MEKRVVVGGPEDLVYVGDECRVQEFRGDGESVREVSLAALSPTAKAKAVAVDSVGDLFVADTGIGGVYEYEASGTAGALRESAVAFTGSSREWISRKQIGLAGREHRSI